MLQIILVFGSFIAIFSLLYMCAAFAYELRADHLLIRWQVLRVVPFIRRRIAYAKIREARRFELRQDWIGGQIFGRFNPRRWIVLVLNPAFPFNRRVLISPEDPEAFLRQLAEKISRR